ncbi:MAG: A24 family peptidase [Lachnospiraceae bacterium]|nr:A24 family peptidase [Lachnospiraceae bacterium]
MPDNPVMRLVQAGLFAFLLIAVSVCDIRSRRIPDSLQIGIAALAALDFSWKNLLGLFVALPFLTVAIACREKGGIGGGDVKLVASMGVVLGMSAGLTASVIGLASFLCYAAVHGFVQREKGKERPGAYPLGPFLAAGGICAYFMKMGGSL